MFENMLFNDESVHIQGECCYGFNMVYHFTDFIIATQGFFNHEQKLQGINRCTPRLVQNSIRKRSISL